ncbi:facilitated trehalose transporter Tret1-like [Diprion similis]|uniref:facilitated trehalose transporter Tret1-like n=1 Tax=Diprion similis TaxID=362088 RepID=UPI001EF864B6|nr:facilitated trehalose transporter Tret1-like [Diprion similis]
MIPSASKLPRSTLWLQWIGGVATTTMMFVIGLTFGWASPYLAQFSTGNSPFPATTSEISWMASMFYLGRLPGAILGFVLNQYFGSKTTMIGTGCGLVLSWILIISANSVEWIYAARFIWGSGIELTSISFALYLGEISSANIRGALIAMTMNGLPLGILAGNSIGAYVSMRIFACISLVPTLFFVVVFVLLPESPYHLIKKSKITEAEKSIMKYNPNSNLSDESKAIQKFVGETNSLNFVNRLRELNVPRNRKSGLIVILFFFFAQSCGLNPLAAYMETIVTRGMVTVVSPSTVPIVANGLGIMAGLAMMYLTEKLGRKKMWIFSSCGITVAMTALGTHFYLLDDGFDADLLQWIPILSMIAFTVCCSLGMYAIPAILISELFAANIRTLAASITCASAAIFALISIEIYQYLLEIINECYIYWMYAILMVLSAILGSILIPETKGKTLTEIQDSMAKM